MDIVDLHTHSLLSDGAYLPMELFRRAECAGYAFLALTDHVDSSNIRRVVPEAARAAREFNRFAGGRLKVVAGAEVTHAPPELIEALVKEARGLGADLVVVHGETTAEPVAPGTNRRAILAGADILAHPGLITADDFQQAVRCGVRLELSARAGHGLANGHIVNLWRRYGGALVIDTDGHHGPDLFTAQKYRQTGLGAGLTGPEITRVHEASVVFAAGKISG